MNKKALTDAKIVAAENPQYKKALVLFLDEEDGGYRIRNLCAGIGKVSEVVTLLDVAHDRELKAMD